jgi:hypothetical protein
MTIVQEMKNPMSIIDGLVKRPEKSEEVIGELEWKYSKLYGEHLELEKEEREEPEIKKEEWHLEF